jgi:hypothetical protein
VGRDEPVAEVGQGSKISGGAKLPMGAAKPGEMGAVMQLTGQQIATETIRA